MEEFISKKDLLVEANISYGQLYRWKRMNLIPEDWFIKKSTPTGQETFFQRDKILERVELILSMKDDASLDDIAGLFNNKTTQDVYSIEDLLARKIVSQAALDVYTSLFDRNRGMETKELFLLQVIEKYLISSVITMEELQQLINLVKEQFERLFTNNGKIYVVRKYGVSFVFATIKADDTILEPGAKLITFIDVVKDTGEISFKAK